MVERIVPNCEQSARRNAQDFLAVVIRNPTVRSIHLKGVAPLARHSRVAVASIENGSWCRLVIVARLRIQVEYRIGCWLEAARVVNRELAWRTEHRA